MASLSLFRVIKTERGGLGRRRELDDFIFNLAKNSQGAKSSSVVLHLISLAPSRAEYDRMNIYRGSWLSIGLRGKLGGGGVVEEKLVSPFLA